MHVDLVENLWLAGYQERVAIAYVDNEDKFVLDCDDTHYRHAIKRSIKGLSPEDALYHLSKQYHGDYFFATTPHQEKDCLFKKQFRLRMKQQPLIQ